MTDALAALTGFLFAGSTAAGLTRRRIEPLSVENWAGRRVPVVLGIALVIGAVGGFLVAASLDGSPGASGLAPAAALAFGVMFLAGLLDDVRGSRARGLRGHISKLGQLRVTTGIVKLLAGVASGVWLAVLAGGSWERVAAGALLIAVAANLANAFDVRPGRALKLTLPILLLTWLVSPDQSVVLLAAAAVGAGVAVLPFDLGERGMLGDAGSNPLGLLAGLGLALILPTWGVMVAAGIALALQVAAETVTISRLIEAVPPLRWYDRLGRRN